MQALSQIVYLIFTISTISPNVERIACNSSPQKR